MTNFENGTETLREERPGVKANRRRDGSQRRKMPGIINPTKNQWCPNQVGPRPSRISCDGASAAGEPPVLPKNLTANGWRRGAFPDEFSGVRRFGVADDGGGATGRFGNQF